MLEGLPVFSSTDGEEALHKIDLAAVAEILFASTEEEALSENDCFGLEQLLKLEPLIGNGTSTLLEMDTYLTQSMGALSEEDLLFSVIGGGNEDDILEGAEQMGNASSDHIFPRKLHLMLEDAENNDFEDVVSWVQGGAAFKVHDNNKFVEEIMPTYFDQTNYESFRRQLNLYGFNRASRGEDCGMYFHEFFLEGDTRLCRSITRTSRSCTKTMAMS
jgi:hypothetical protein